MGIYLDFIILSDGHRADIVFLPQFLGKGRRHYLPANVRRCIEVPLAVLAAVRSHKRIELHFDYINKHNANVKASIHNSLLVFKLAYI